VSLLAQWIQEPRRKVAGEIQGGRELNQMTIGRFNMNCHSERSEESASFLNAGKSRFLTSFGMTRTGLSLSAKYITKCCFSEVNSFPLHRAERIQHPL
jgi:hypothetical protein